jgi:hypothetical protein
MVSVAKAISVWVRDGIIQADNIVNGVSTITNLSVNGRNASIPQIAIDSLGNAIAVWTLNNGTNTIIQASHYTNGSWLAPESVINLSLAGGDASSPQIAIDNNTGNAIAVWTRLDGSNSIIQASRYSYTNGSWLAPTSVVDLSLTGRNAGSPQIVIDNNTGNALAVWTRLDSSNSIIQASRYTNGSWLAPTSVIDLSFASGSSPQIAIDNNTGNAIAVWTRSDSLNDIIQASRYSYTNDSWLAPTSVVDLSLASEIASSPQIAIDNNTGNAIAVWTRFDGSNDIIQASRYTNGSWLAPTSVVDLSLAGRSAFAPQIAIDNNTGNAIAVWTRLDGSNSIIQASRYSLGSWLAPTSVIDLSLAGGNAVYPQIAIDNYVEPTTAPPTTAPPTTAPPTNFTTVRFSIDANFNSIITDAQTLANYENVLIDQIVVFTGAPKSTITIISVTPGSIVNELTLPTEYVAALQNAVNNGLFYIIINGVTYRAIPGSFIIVDNICFQRGTMILTPNGYRTVETLKKGDLVTTAQGVIVKIQKVTSFVGKRDKCLLYVLNKDSLAPNMPLMDLYMSEGHAYRHKGKWSHMKCSSLSMEVDVDDIEYYNIAVNNYIENTLIANGVEVESLFNMKGLKMTWDCKTDNCKPIIELKN